MDTGHVRRASARRGMLLVAAGAASWGTIGVAVSVLYRIAATDALSISFLRLALAAPVLLVLSSIGAGRPLHHIARRDLAVMCLMGAGYAAYQLCYFAAIARIGVALAVVLNICSGPIFIALLARGFLGERMTVAMGTALGGALCGTVLVVAAPGQATAAGSLLGAGLALGAGAAYAVVTVCARQVAPRYHPVQPLAVGFGVGALLLLPLVLRSGLAWPIRRSAGCCWCISRWCRRWWAIRSTCGACAARPPMAPPSSPCWNHWSRPSWQRCCSASRSQRFACLAECSWPAVLGCWWSSTGAKVRHQVQRAEPGVLSPESDAGS